MAQRGKATLQDVAAAAGVSSTTASMILRGKTGVSFSQETIERVLDAAERLNYRKITARGCFDRPTIAIIMGLTTSLYYTFLAQSITQRANALGIDTLIFETHDTAERELRHIHTISRLGISGVIYTGIPYNKSAALDLGRQIPSVVINNQDIDMPFDSVKTDTYLCGKIAANHLWELGHRDIAFIEIDRWQGKWCSLRLQGVQDFLQKCPDVRLTVYKRPGPDTLHPGSFIETRDLARSMAEEALKDSRHTGFICVSDYCAYGVLDTLSAHGLKVPEDYSVCACDNLYPSDLPGVSLTTIDRHPIEIGASCFDLLYQRISNRSAGSTEHITRIEYGSTLVLRNSTGIPRSHPTPYQSKEERCINS